MSSIHDNQHSGSSYNGRPSRNDGFGIPAPAQAPKFPTTTPAPEAPQSLGPPSQQHHHSQHQSESPGQGPRSNNGHLGQKQDRQSNTYRSEEEPVTHTTPTQVQNYGSHPQNGNDRIKGPHFNNGQAGQQHRENTDRSLRAPHHSGWPPAQVQSYGHLPQNMNDRIVRPSPQYSQRAGKKKALFIGINYHGQAGLELKGCINDVRYIKGLIISKYGYKEEDIVVLTDAFGTDPRAIPTHSNMLQAMANLVRNAQPEDSLFFHYSGHGYQVPCTEDDEIDGEDEVILSVDSKYIVDNIIHEIMVKPLPKGCRLTTMFDCCHSGTVMDLPYVYSEAKHDTATASTSYPRGDLNDRALHFYTDSGRTNKQRRAEEVMKTKRTSLADVVSLCSCEDSRQSAEIKVAGETFFGVMSYAFLTTLSDKEHQSYRELMLNIRKFMKEKKYNQTAQLSSSHSMNYEVMFAC